MDMRTFLQRMTASEEAETEWLELLSQLEYVGCRKIMRAVPFERMNAEILQHVNEESLHAYLLRQLVENRGLNRPWGQTPLAQAGWEYFQTLDAKVTALTEELPYPAVSWIVEKRVLSVYPAYIAVTSDPGVRDVLSQILAQEKRHSKQFDLALNSEKQRAAVEIEEMLWAVFQQKALATVSEECSNASRLPMNEAPVFL